MTVSWGFWNCAKPESGAILLYTVLVVATELEENVEFRLETHRSPASPLFKCPMILLCDYPMFTGLCVETMPCFVNATATRTCEIPLAVESTLWGKVKALYR